MSLCLKQRLHPLATDGGSETGFRSAWVGVDPRPKRFRDLRIERVLDRDVPVATSFRSRLFGLAHLERARAGAGLLIPGCACVHTFGMRFDLDLWFFDGRGKVVAVRCGLRPRRIAFCGKAAAVLEIPSVQGGEFSGLAP